MTQTATVSNTQAAEALSEVAELLSQQGGNPFRVRAYRTAAESVRGLERPLAELVREQGVDGLEQLPGIGRSLARSLERLVRTGRLSLADRLRAIRDSENVFRTVPQIGSELAHRIHEQLQIDTLAELWAAARDGRLERVPGMGAKRVQAVRETLAGRLVRPDEVAARSAAPPATRAPPPPPTLDVPIATLLDIDREYREQARRGRLPRITPRRFNPSLEAWLPILTTRRDGARYTAMFSNTAKAHELGAVRDWVVIVRDEPNSRARWTAITSMFGELRGRRVIRGRENECAAYYASLPQSE